MKTVKVMVDVIVKEDGNIVIPMENIAKAIGEAESRERSFSRRIALAKKIDGWAKRNGCDRVKPMTVITFLEAYGLLDDERVDALLESEAHHDH